MPLSDRISLSKKNFIEAFKKSLGVVSTACDAVGISRQTYYHWCREDPEFKAQSEEQSESTIDFVESKLYELINGVTVQKEGKDGPVIYDLPPCKTSIIFYLKCKAKKRGYRESAPIENGTVTEPITFKIGDQEFKIN